MRSNETKVVPYVCFKFLCFGGSSRSIATVDKMGWLKDQTIARDRKCRIGMFNLDQTWKTSKCKVSSLCNLKFLIVNIGDTMIELRAFSTKSRINTV